MLPYSRAVEEMNQWLIKEDRFSLFGNFAAVGLLVVALLLMKGAV